ncbi:MULTISPECIES: glutaredoxin 3 [Limibacillus]|uniref:Glutaredoxin n=1 Tax=Limibacillus halophilus TaxID=1579333 RepID=A0A839SU64_9PROT|nr:glutaredoxin 3 [Limibacillus halophilus]MBB3066331.1 glutaredoxin 3 [Limibacillus halophilus]
MPKIEIYSSMLCPYCHRAKQLLKAKGAAFEEIDVFLKPSARQAMTERAGGRTSVPQIFIDGKHVGGCDEIYALDRKGELDPLLSGSA